MESTYVKTLNNNINSNTVSKASLCMFMSVLLGMRLVSSRALLTCLSMATLATTAQAAPSTLAVKLSVFDCGVIGIEDVSSFGIINIETPVRKLFVPCYLIQHPDGLMIWDTGLSPAMAGQGKIDVGNGFSVNYKRAFVEQLADMNITPADIKYLGLSHMHSDHAGGANPFNNAALLVQRAEFNAAFGEQELAHFDRSVYSELAGNDQYLLDGDHDVFGDGSVRILSMPGHTPGHQVLAVDLPDTGLIVLSGDQYHFVISRRLRRMPEFNIDRAQTHASMDRLEAWLLEHDATLWIEHDLKFAQSLRLAPAVYR